MKIEFITLSEDGKQSKRFVPYPTTPLLWPIMAALTPEEIELSVQDEYYQPLSFDSNSDLVAITVSTPIAPRAYRLGQKLRERGKQVVYGGSHITQIQKYPKFSREPFDYGDALAIFVGDAEETWPQFIADFISGNRMQEVYVGQPYKFNHHIIPKRNVWKRQGLQRIFPEVISIESSRGCTGKCTFCCANGKYTVRSITDLAEEIQSLGSKYYNFVDSNLGLSTDHFRQFLALMQEQKVTWSGSAFLPALKGKGRALKEAGCEIIYIGIESVNHKSAAEAHKSYIDINTCREIIDEMHSEGVSVIGSFVFGFDNDDKTIFERTLEFALQARLDDASFHILMPYPGTPVFDSLYAESRLIYTDFPNDWSLYTRDEVVYQPAQMTPEELKDGYAWLNKKFYSPNAIRQRLGSSFFTKKGAGFWFANLLKWSQLF